MAGKKVENEEKKSLKGIGICQENDIIGLHFFVGGWLLKKLKPLIRRNMNKRAG
jgi:hypothetical protein